MSNPDHPITTRSDAPAGPIAPADGSRSFTARVLGETFRRHGARLGTAWIAILVLGAVFAPWLANSHPILMKDANDQWSSPLLRHLTLTDVTLLVVFFSTVWTMLIRRAPMSARLLYVVSMGVITVLLAKWPTLPATLRQYARTDLAAGLEPWCSAPRSYMVTGLLALLGLPALSYLLFRMKQSTRFSRVFALAWYLVVCVLLIVLPVRPPQAIVYSQYREAKVAGEITFALHTPIPFAPMDYRRDADDASLKAPSLTHWLGTETNGADLLSRMIHASRVALAIGLISTGIALIIGVFLGSLMGYFSGTIDMLGMRLVEIVEAIPTLFLLIIFVSFFERNLYFMMVIIGMTGWTGYCRFIRAEYLRLREQDFIQAARACGLSIWSILFRHMLPNGVGPVLVSASFGVASAILAETTLSFLGLGLVDEPSWGEMLNQALGIGGTFHWWLATFPGLAIFLTVFGYNLVGEALRDAIDPHTVRATTG